MLNQGLWVCFLEYGEVTSEMAMLLAFVLFGAVLSQMIGTVDIVPPLGLAALVIFVIRPMILGVVLIKARMSWQAHAFISWFGPRGLNSLLLALLVVQAGIPGSELLLATVGVVVIASIAIHGGTATPVVAWSGTVGLPPERHWLNNGRPRWPVCLVIMRAKSPWLSPRNWQSG